MNTKANGYTLNIYRFMKNTCRRDYRPQLFHTKKWALWWIIAAYKRKGESLDQVLYGSAFSSALQRREMGWWDGADDILRPRPSTISRLISMCIKKNKNLYKRERGVMIQPGLHLAICVATWLVLFLQITVFACGVCIFQAPFCVHDKWKLHGNIGTGQLLSDLCLFGHQFA